MKPASGLKPYLGTMTAVMPLSPPQGHPWAQVLSVPSTAPGTRSFCRLLCQGEFHVALATLLTSSESKSIMWMFGGQVNVCVLATREAGKNQFWLLSCEGEDIFKIQKGFWVAPDMTGVHHRAYLTMYVRAQGTQSREQIEEMKRRTYI